MFVQEIFTSSLQESSGFSLRGSVTPDLVASKVWLLKELSQINPHYDVAYVLGSWYSNLALLIHLTDLISADRVINVDTNAEFLRTGAKLLKFAGVDFPVRHIKKDANQLDYEQLTMSSVVINTSLQNMHDNAWFTNIPSGVLVAMQARDHDPDIEYNSVNDIDQRFPLAETLYQGTIALQDPETPYHRFMKIGIK